MGITQAEIRRFDKLFAAAAGTGKYHSIVKLFDEYYDAFKKPLNIERFEVWVEVTGGLGLVIKWVDDLKHIKCVFVYD